MDFKPKDLIVEEFASKSTEDSKSLYASYTNNSSSNIQPKSPSELAGMSNIPNDTLSKIYRSPFENDEFTSACPFCDIFKTDPKNQILPGQNNEHFVAIRKLYKSKNVNFLVISRAHVPNLKTREGDVVRQIDMNDLVDFVNEFSKGKDWSMTINNGTNAGQEVFHFHAHVSSNDKPETWGI